MDAGAAGVLSPHTSSRQTLTVPSLTVRKELSPSAASPCTCPERISNRFKMWGWSACVFNSADRPAAKHGLGHSERHEKRQQKGTQATPSANPDAPAKGG